MTAEEEQALRAENAALKAQVAQLLPLVAQVEPLKEQVRQLSELVQALQERLKKDSHNSHLPPSSDRFGRRPKSLRQPSGKRPGGQEGHVGSTLCLSEHPDAVIVHEVENCTHCQHDLRGVACLQVERRQVIDLPPKRVVVIEHQAQCKCCPA